MTLFDSTHRGASIQVDVEGRCKVQLDGHDITQGITGVTLEISQGLYPRLVLDLSALEVDVTTDGQIGVVIPDATAEVLTRLGWAPPPQP
ncbi:hypothetical protein [Amycolatopsis thermoflava]|uniref:hypothetical protein n=1 Tax=Amycolatopsis thermoflava TaxID=84480 RepID=UPI00041AC3F9|nr:hypothetical protein [Amycolatopsis thermoflava]